MTLRGLHRKLGLFVGALWLFQALTGALVVFSYEIDDATVAGAAARLDPAKLGARLDALIRSGAMVESVWSTGSGTDRFDIGLTTAAGRSETLRVDGAGVPLRRASDAERTIVHTVLDALSTAHESLFAGTVGRWLMGVSGAVLLVNLLSGVWFARSQWRGWRAALLRQPAGARAARFLGWHRLVGLWVAIPAIVVVISGIGLAYRAELESLSGAATEQQRAAAARNLGPARIAAAKAIEIALARYPDSDLTALVFPSAEAPWYRVRLLTADERPWVWGTTTLLIDAADTRVLAVSDERTKTGFQRLLDALYPLHTGEFAGVMMRCVVLLTGLGLAVLFGFGEASWSARRT